MGGMSKLSQFSTTPAAPESEPEQPPARKPKTADKTKGKAPKQNKLITVNIKIGEHQQEWLASTARQVRSNNDDPVPPADRVYPQHLIQMAIDLLKAAEVDWEEIRNADDLRKALNL